MVLCFYELHNWEQEDLAWRMKDLLVIERDPA